MKSAIMYSVVFILTISSKGVFGATIVQPGLSPYSSLIECEGYSSDISMNAVFIPASDTKDDPTKYKGAFAENLIRLSLSKTIGTLQKVQDEYIFIFPGDGIYAIQSKTGAYNFFGQANKIRKLKNCMDAYIGTAVIDNKNHNNVFDRIFGSYLCEDAPTSKKQYYLNIDYIKMLDIAHNIHNDYSSNKFSVILNNTTFIANLSVNPGHGEIRPLNKTINPISIDVENDNISNIKTDGIALSCKPATKYDLLHYFKLSTVGAS